MKAAVSEAYGPPEVVRLVEVDRPVPAAREALVRVHATTVNRTDCGYRSGVPRVVRLITGVGRPRRKILGTEFAGVVEEAGAQVTRFAVGDRVFGYCEGRFGAHAEFLAVAEDSHVAPMPAGLDFAEVAPSTEGSHYALSFLTTAKVGQGSEVLVNGATGAIGSAAVQLLRNAGATVTAVCAGPHLDLVRGLGADRVIDYTTEDFTNDTQRYDAVFDTVGKSSFGRCRHLLKPRGRYLSSELGRFGQNPLLALASPLFLGRRRVNFPMLPRGVNFARHFLDLIEAGRFRPVIDRHYPLGDIVEAYRYVETGQKIGNVVIDVAQR
jgi:NADPH:quinone reductase-like Zn-dependent oxidoreductase